MNKDKTITIPNADEEFDDPYIHAVSTKEFVETVEQAIQEEKDDPVTPNEDEITYTKPPDNTVIMNIYIPIESLAYL